MSAIERMIVDSLASRLLVKPAALRTAIAQVGAEQRQKLLQTAGLTPAETSALNACRKNGIKKRDPARVRKAGTCRSAAARSAIAKLKATAAQPDLVALKADVAQSLATKLGTTPDVVLTAVRAELEQRLTQAVAIGLVTQKGHDLALACFDDPATCDLTALRAEVHLGHHAPAASAPGQMSPGGRGSSTPLR